MQIYESESLGYDDCPDSGPGTFFVNYAHDHLTTFKSCDRGFMDQ